MDFGVADACKHDDTAGTGGQQFGYEIQPVFSAEVYIEQYDIGALARGQIEGRRATARFSDHGHSGLTLYNHSQSGAYYSVIIDEQYAYDLFFRFRHKLRVTASANGPAGDESLWPNAAAHPRPRSFQLCFSRILLHQSSAQQAQCIAQRRK
jgi:hypothetical protein